MLMEADLAKICQFIVQKQHDNILTDPASACTAQINFFSLYINSLIQIEITEWGVRV